MSNPGHYDPKSLADVLEEELGSQCEEGFTQQAPLEEKEARLKALYDRIHALTTKRSALCLSGGGTRSASFCLGVLQGLAKYGLLNRFDYLSTVAGGGHVGGWLSALIQRHPHGCEGVFDELKRGNISLLDPQSTLVRHLFTFSKYVAPKFGVLSIDTWTFAVTFLSNTLLTWIVLVSWLAAVLMIPRFCLVAVLSQPPAWMLYALLVSAFGLLAIVACYPVLDRPSLGNARSSQKRFLMCHLAPLCLASLFLSEWWAGFSNTSSNAATLIVTPMPIIFFFTAASVMGSMTGLMLPGQSRLFTQVRRFTRLREILAATISPVVAGLVTWVILRTLLTDPARDVRKYICLAPALVLASTLFVSLISGALLTRVTSDDDREWWARSNAWLLIAIIGWTALNTMFVWGSTGLSYLEKYRVFKALSDEAIGAVGGFIGLLTALAGFSPKTAGKGKTTTYLVAAAVLFFLLLTIGVSRILDGHADLFANPGLLYLQEYRSEFFRLAVSVSVLVLLGAALGAFLSVNKFSLHSMFRNRLVRGYLGASRRFERRPHSFTGFDPADNLQMADLAPGKPLHIVNVALNIVKGQALGWAEQAVESFTISRLHSGSWRLGYRASNEYAGGISLGTAMAISGVSANRTLGYHKSWPVRFLMTLFNLRLGWWLGNPGRSGARTWKLPGSAYSMGPLIAEATGSTTDTYRYVNLSDGGHFDNLGMYEMIVRRCHFIVAVDVSRDSTYVFQDLGNAIHKIGQDLGVPVEIDVAPLKLKSKRARAHSALGIIRYSSVDGPDAPDGFVLLMKPALNGDEPVDISAYAASQKDFPHEDTSYQSFDEWQWDSYRNLGFHSVEALCRHGGTLESLFQRDAFL